MDSIAKLAPVRARRADRRNGLHALVQGVAADLLTTIARRNFSAFVTDRLARLGRLKGIRVSEVTNTLAPRHRQPIRARDHVGFVVPMRESGRAMLLEAT